MILVKLQTTTTGSTTTSYPVAPMHMWFYQKVDGNPLNLAGLLLSMASHKIYSEQKG